MISGPQLSLHLVLGPDGLPMFSFPVVHWPRALILLGFPGSAVQPLRAMHCGWREGAEMPAPGCGSDLSVCLVCLAGSLVSHAAWAAGVLESGAPLMPLGLSRPL